MLTVPLAVRLSTPSGDKHVTRRLRDLVIRSVVPGGYASCELDFDQPLATTDPAVAVYGKIYVYDGRHGGTVWEGRQEDPGRAASANGQTWTLAGFGPSAHAQDDPITVCYVEHGNEVWQPSPFGNQNGSVGSTDSAPPSLKVAAPNGTVLVTGAHVDALCRLLEDCGQSLARVTVTWTAGVTDATCAACIFVSTLGGSVTQLPVTPQTLSPGGGTITRVITTDIPAGDDRVAFSLVRSGASGTIVDDTHWIAAQPIVVQGTRYTAAGVEQTAGATYTSDTVVASDVVADLLGRILTEFDGATASITATSFAIDRLVYPDPTTPAQILDDLMTLESAYYWAAWESTASGNARFEWSAWPSTVRYETSITGDFDSPGDVGDLYNQALFRYRDRNGRTRSVFRTLAQPDLAAAGLTRTATQDLGDNIGSKANAQQAADNFLGDHNSIPNAGTLNVSTPILDLVAGRMVQPWEIVPGTLIRVRGVLPRVDALNATDRDAVTVFRLFSTEYRASTNTCQLGLDSYSRSMANEVFKAHRRIDQLRKR